jgi:hypothetical protein
MMIPGQCFWTGLAIAKRSITASTFFQLGNAVAYIVIYGVLNEYGMYFLQYINQSILDIMRSIVLVGIGLLTLNSIWKNKPPTKKVQLGVNLTPRSSDGLQIFFLGGILVFTNPMVYALLIPYTEPVVKLQHHWLIYAVFIRLIIIFPVYLAVYSVASKVEMILNGLWSKLFWSAISLFPIYYGVKLLK